MNNSASASGVQKQLDTFVMEDGIKLTQEQRGDLTIVNTYEDDELIHTATVNSSTGEIPYYW